MVVKASKKEGTAEEQVRGGLIVRPGMHRVRGAMLYTAWEVQ